MSTQAKPRRTSQRHSASTQFAAPTNVFNTDLLKRVGSLSGRRSSTPGVKRSGSRCSKRMSHHKTVTTSSTANMGCASSILKVPGGTRESLAEIENPSFATYNPPEEEAEFVCPKHASSSRLPPTWNHIHDRFIAYLSTHAQLDKHGRVPRHEEWRERCTSEEITELVMERFPEIGLYIKVKMIDNRLAILDQAENDYFKMPYGAYAGEEWGRGI